MAALAIHQSSSIEHGDRDTGDKEERKQGAVFAVALECRLERADHEHKPEHQADEEQDLPQPSQVDIFETLASEPEPQVAELLLDAHPFACQGSANDENQCGEQHIDSQALELRLMAADRRANVQAGRKP